MLENDLPPPGPPGGKVPAKKAPSGAILPGAGPYTHRKRQAKKGKKRLFAVKNGEESLPAPCNPLCPVYNRNVRTSHLRTAQERKR